MESTGSRGLAAPVAIAATALALLAGCGGGESPEEEVHNHRVRADTTMTTATPPLTKAQFVRRINRTCRHRWPTIAGNFAEYSGTQDSKQPKDERIAEAIQLSLMAGLDFYFFDGIYNLGSPPGEEKTIEAIIGPFQAAVELGEKRPEFDSLAQVPERFAEFNRKARRYGLDECLVDRAHLRPIEA